MFLKSHRKWTSPSLKPSEIEAFSKGYKSAGIDPKRFVEYYLRLCFTGICCEALVLECLPA